MVRSHINESKLLISIILAFFILYLIVDRIHSESEEEKTRKEKTKPFWTRISHQKNTTRPGIEPKTSGSRQSAFTNRLQWPAFYM